MSHTPPRTLLDLDPSRPVVAPVDAATLVLIRDRVGGLEVFCVRRSQGSRFMGGAVVFPGGRVEDDDHDVAWANVSGAPPAGVTRALAVAACRESLEEAAILPVDRLLSDDDVVHLRQALSSGPAVLRELLQQRGLRLALSSLVPFARWVTPAAERRRFDARFFMVHAPAGQSGTHDNHETTECFWARPFDVLQRWDAGEIQLAPPTHHTLWSLSQASSVDEALSHARRRTMHAIHPHLVDVDGTSALTLPGDPEHPEPVRLLDGASRYVLRGEQWRPETMER